MKLKKRVYVYLLIAILCVLYSAKVAVSGYGTLFFLIWIFIAAVLGGLALAAQKGLWKKLPKVLRGIIIGVCAIGIGCFLWVEGLILSQVNAQGDDNLDYIIVLGAQVREDGPSSILAARLNAAYRYLEAHPDTKVVVSGGQGSNEPWSEAEGMSRYLVGKGIASDRIILEPESFNTKQNIENSMKLIGDKDAKIGIATSNFHVYRACQIAKKQGVENVSGIAGNVILLYMPQNMFREFFGIVKDTLVGNM